MTIDELTVKITVAAEEAEAALDALLEKVRAFQEKTGLALQLDAGSWDSQLAETGEGFQQAGEQAEALADDPEAKLRESDYLKLYDDIVTEGKGLYDGKIIR